MTKSKTIPEGYYSEEHIANLLGKTTKTLQFYRSRQRDDLCPPHHKVGHQILYKKEIFDNWLSSKQINHKKKKSQK